MFKKQATEIKVRKFASKASGPQKKTKKLSRGNFNPSGFGIKHSPRGNEDLGTCLYLDKLKKLPLEKEQNVFKLLQLKLY